VFALKPCNLHGEVVEKGKPCLKSNR